MMKYRTSAILALLTLLSSLLVFETPAHASSVTVNVLATNVSGTPTGVTLAAGETFAVQASGSWCSGGIKNDGTPSCGGPDGIRPPNPGEEVDLVLPDELIGMLIGRIGNSVFPIGSSAQITAQASGQLYLLMNDRTCCYQDNSGHVTATVDVDSIPAPTLPDLSIVDTKPIQVVEGADINDDGRIDLVDGKPLVIRVFAEVDDPNATLDPGTRVDVTVDFQGISSQRSVEVAGLRLAPVDFFFPSVSGPGNYPISARIDPTNDIAEIDEENNEGLAQTSVLETSGMSVVYVKADCFGDLTQYSQTAFQGSQFLLGQWPVAPSEFDTQVSDQSMQCGDDLLSDTLNLWLTGKRVYPLANRIVGIANQSWFDARYPGAFGITYSCGLSTQFVQEGHWKVTAHEIGHGFQLSDAYGSLSEDRLCDQPPRPGPSSGYWVEQRIPIEAPASLMEGEFGTTFPNTHQWISHGDYEHLLSHKTQHVDPEVLLVSGRIEKEGTIEFAPLYRLESGVIDEAFPGDFSLVLRGPGDEVLYELPFDVRFLLLAEPTIEVDTVPFMFTIPYVSDAETIEVQHLGMTLEQDQIAYRLLFDAISTVPDHGFSRNPEQRRTALLNKVLAFGSQLDQGNTRGAIQNLTNDIRKHVDQWLIDGFAVHPTEYSKTELLDLIDALLERLEQ